ncbi:hypothetical protein L1049_008976 [Liquidambar formosana]|uniref:Uncharacterized protein n=1 Tax=Liquidambar formosana TaxID=63359 RepID=A0AAP0X8M6_LIQFO
MAGLQYYFFPTDFLYPRPQSVNGNSSNKPVLPIQTQKRDGSDKVLQAQSSSPLVKAPIKEGNQAGSQEGCALCLGGFNTSGFPRTSLAGLFASRKPFIGLPVEFKFKLW